MGKSVGKRTSVAGRETRPLKDLSLLKKGDTVMVIAGGNKKKRPTQGKSGKILAFGGKRNDRVLVEGLNIIKRHQRATTPGQVAGIIEKEASIHLSNVMFYSEKAQRPVRLKQRLLEDGRKVRGYTDRSSGEFVQIDS